MAPQTENLTEISKDAQESIRSALKDWRTAQIDVEIKEGEKQRKEFLERFPLNNWDNMTLDDYFLGTTDTYKNSYSWWLEWGTKSAGGIGGGSATKHLIFMRRNRAMAFPQEYSSAEEAWATIKPGFIEMLRLASEKKFEEAYEVPVLNRAKVVKMKTLYLYFSSDLLPIFSIEHAKHFNRAIGLSDLSEDRVFLNRQLLQGLRSLPELSKLGTLEIGYFLYSWKPPRRGPRAYKITPGDVKKNLGDCIKGSYICIPTYGINDLGQYNSTTEIYEALAAPDLDESASKHFQIAKQLWMFREMQTGDQVVVNTGTTAICAVGTVTSNGYLYNSDRTTCRHTNSVRWNTTKIRKLGRRLPWAATSVKKLSVPVFRSLFATSEEPHVETDNAELFDEINNVLQRRGQIILYGPPGTGKTYLARDFARWYLSDNTTDRKPKPAGKKTVDFEGRLSQITFHPSYSYEDFVEGYRPRKMQSETLSLELVDGKFKELCLRAASDPQNTYLLIIDEINRGNIPKIFGELITLIEKDKRENYQLTLAQSRNTFTVPQNLAIIGTMNTADRSIQQIDTALRRRFGFIEVMPRPDLLEGADVGELKLDVFLDKINKRLRIRDRDRQVGHALFFSKGEVINSCTDFAAIFRNELIPLLQEYYFENYADLQQLLGPKIVDLESQTIKDIVYEPIELCSVLANTFGVNEF
jgi:5-methylcytosine-specific restriction protein B